MTKYTNKLNAFTLAEVLITLGVIGVVAAVTLPTLVQHYKKQSTSARLKKFYSTMQQAILRSEIDNGPSKYWEFSRCAVENGKYDYDKNHKFTYNFINKYITPYMNYNKITEGSYTPATENEDAIQQDVKLYLSDGSTVTFWYGWCLDFIYDVNGTTAPNISGRDIYRFTFCFPASDPAHPELVGFKPYNSAYYPNRASAMQGCKASDATCSVLLQYDNWEFKDDYPYKL